MSSGFSFSRSSLGEGGRGLAEQDDDDLGLSEAQGAAGKVGARTGTHPHQLTEWEGPVCLLDAAALSAAGAGPPRR